MQSCKQAGDNSSSISSSSSRRSKSKSKSLFKSLSKSLSRSSSTSSRQADRTEKGCAAHLPTLYFSKGLEQTGGRKQEAQIVLVHASSEKHSVICRVQQKRKMATQIKLSLASQTSQK